MDNITNTIVQINITIVVYNEYHETSHRNICVNEKLLSYNKKTVKVGPHYSLTLFYLNFERIKDSCQ